jgi:hypothetical protein
MKSPINKIRGHFWRIEKMNQTFKVSFQTRINLRILCGRKIRETNLTRRRSIFIIGPRAINTVQYSMQD